MIRYLHREEIEDTRWNRVLAISGYETVYAYTWYMDACAEDWGGLVMGEYEYIMPVPFRRKLGFRYSYQPRFCQQLGIYSEKEVDRETQLLFLKELKNRFSFGDYAFNEGNRLEITDIRELTNNSNYVLSLSSKYTELHGSYSSNCRRNVKKALASGLHFSDQISIEELVQLKKQYDHRRHPEEHYIGLINMFSGLEQKGKVKACGAKLENGLCAGAIFAFSEKRVHYLLSVSSEEGKEKSGMFHVIDQFIRLHAGSAVDLDFEGSNISSIARFFEGFGARPRQYQRLTLNPRLGKLIRGLKRLGHHG